MAAVLVNWVQWNLKDKQELVLSVDDGGIEDNLVVTLNDRSTSELLSTTVVLPVSIVGRSSSEGYSIDFSGQSLIDNLDYLLSVINDLKGGENN